MAHMVETMAYAGEVPWHGLGVQVNPNLSPKEMMKEANVDWTVEKRPLYYNGMDKTLTFNSEELEILTELFSEVAALEYPVSETPEYDALWEKIVS